MKPDCVDLTIKTLKCAWNYVLLPALIMIMNVPEEVECIKDDVKDIHNRSIEASRAAAEAEEDHIRVRMEKRALELRTMAFRMEDVIDEYKNKCEVQQPCDPGCGIFPLEDAEFINTTCCHRLQIALKIKSIHSSLRKLNERYERVDTKFKSSSKQGQGRRSRYTGNEVVSNRWETNKPSGVIVGLEGPCKKLIDWLEKDQQKCSVFAVVGMAGQGKTALAWKIYTEQKERRKFNACVWIDVPRFDDNPADLFKYLLQELHKQAGDPPPPEDMDKLIPLITEVKSYLQKRRYVLFFDEVWEHNFQNINIEVFVGCNDLGSKIIITTRNNEVAETCWGSTSVEVHEMQPLTLGESSKLFDEAAFKHDDNNRSRKEECGEMPSKIIEECQCLPLGIVAIGKLVAKKIEVAFDWKSNIEKAGITKSLSLSYDDLDNNLKFCFLYFGIYPPKYEIKSKRLIRQWIAEGFVKNDKSAKTLEEIGEGYLNDLIGRNLVQVSSFTIDKKSRKSRKARSCRVHYLIHDMILKKFEDFDFCRCISEDDQSDKRMITRRLSITANHNGDSRRLFDDLPKKVESKFIRSLLFFTKEAVVTKESVESIPKSYEQLKVLDFEDAQLSDVPENLGDLVLLKYLSFRGIGIQSLPNSIGKLFNLETLDVRQTAMTTIPREVSKLTMLRHLLVDDMSLIQLKDGIGGMKSLQTLRGVKIDGHGVELIKELGKLSLLRDLKLTNVGGEHGSNLCSSINQMKNLEKLHIVAKPGNEVIDLQKLNESSDLQKLCLQGKFELPKLKNLLKLALSDDNEREHLHFPDGVVPNLKELELGSLHSLSSITIASKALPSLKEFKLKDIPQLMMAPSGIQHLGKLEVLTIQNMPAEIEQSIALAVPRVRINH